ncbi:GerAB/ArcD/ProY family transporter [Sporosarcina sp. Marseille-Q4063]|uniref:GerAB/ArcD/ProY family transporter n=1 Tax=Sporosarcina sp. Marseille-Q4063 TaxID=2810514 RepID=UPI001BAED3A9|nr:GerAB/ArcD/ProY family transporter [Sporosarcina sp. Marseille-Q4063]QUW22383.1 GerAB/ArcD/ProY family transporter [Sporosarcina sp. Marseille-Q4063]
MNVNFSRTQFFLFLFIAQTGAVFITFQAPLIETAGRDASLLFIGAGILHYAILLFYERYYQRFKLGKITSWLYISYWLYITVSFLSYIDYSLAVWAFPKTPQFVVIGVMVLVSLYANLSKPETSVNISVVLIPMIPVFMFFLLMAWPEFEWTYLVPLGEATTPELFKGMLQTQFTFIGIELFLIFRPFVDKNLKVKGWPLFVYQLIWFSFFFFTLAVCMLYFTLEDFNLIPEPLMYILKSQEVTFVQRLDLFFIYIWMTWSIITVILFSFTALFVHKTHYKAKRKRTVIIFHLLLFLLPFLSLSKEVTEKIQASTIYVHLIFAIFLPVIIILVNRRKTA